MKKIKILVAVLLVGVMALGLIACGGKTLDGTYSKKGLLGQESFSFEGDKFTQKAALGIELTGTYEIDGDKIIFTYDDVEDIADELGAELEDGANSASFSFAENDDGSITIEGQTYEKE